jgi:adiponectin receptor
MFESCLKKNMINDKYEITYISLQQITVKDIEKERRINIKTNLAPEILKVEIKNNNFLVITTDNSLIVGDLTTQKYSEVPWNNSDSCRFDFNNLNLQNVYKGSFPLLNDTFEKMSTSLDNLTSSFQDFMKSLSNKFIEVREKLLDLMELENIKLGKEEDINIYFNRSPKKLRRWPLFIFLISAILCLTFSAVYHLIGCVSKTYHEVLSRFDYGGISLLVTGSCFPPYYYFFYCEPKFSIFYLIFISTFGITTFCLSLTKSFNSPKMREFRGKLFLIFGLSAGIPIVHLSIVGDKLIGYNPDLRLLFWYLGGVTYVIGGIIYITRFPEKKFPGKFDYFGSSHQIFHFAVVIAAYFHYLGSLDAYYSRFNYLC